MRLFSGPGQFHHSSPPGFVLLRISFTCTIDCFPLPPPVLSSFLFILIPPPTPNFMSLLRWAPSRAFAKKIKWDSSRRKKGKERRRKNESAFSKTSEYWEGWTIIVKEKRRKTIIWEMTCRLADFTSDSTTLPFGSLPSAPQNGMLFSNSATAAKHSNLMVNCDEQWVCRRVLWYPS